MLRFRIGQSWKRESSRQPVDSLALELDGVNLLSGANEESLGRVVPELVDGVFAIAREGMRFAQLSLSEAHLEVALQRTGTQVDLWVVSLARPARLSRPPVRLELDELIDATVRCARALARDLEQVAPTQARGARHRQMLKKLTSLARGPIAERKARPPPTGYSFRQFAIRPFTFAFEILDAQDLLLAPDRSGQGALPSLLGPGWVALRGEADDELWRGEGVPFLLALELSRQAGELVRAIDADEHCFRLVPAGVGAAWTVRIPEGKVELPRRTVDLGSRQLARSMYELGLGVTFAAIARSKGHAKNPYVQELVARCQEGLRHLKEVVPPATAEPPRPHRRRTPRAATRPIPVSGRLRRLRFEPLWEKTNLGERGALLVGARGPLFASAESAFGFSLTGELLFRRVATHGVATSADGWSVCASLNRVVAFAPPGRSAGTAQVPSARWLRDHDGTTLGPVLQRKGGLLVTTTGSNGAIAFCEMTGRERWRLEPPRTQVSHLTLHGHRALLATDSGFLYGVELRDGQVCFRMRAALPFVHPPVPSGRRLLAILSRGDRTAVFGADAHTGHVSWTRELSLTGPTAPLPIGARLYLAGHSEGAATLHCLGPRGVSLWERRLPLGRGPLSLLPVGEAVLAVDAAGASALLTVDGRIDWRLGAPGEDLPVRVAPQLVRGVLLIAGDAVRAVDARGGHVLAEISGGHGLVGLEVDRKMNLFLLDEDSTLRALRLSSHFAVVGGR